MARKEIHVDLSRYPGAAIPAKNPEIVRDLTEAAWNALADRNKALGGSITNGDSANVLCALAFLFGRHVAASVGARVTRENAAALASQVAWALREGLGIPTES